MAEGDVSGNGYATAEVVAAGSGSAVTFDGFASERPGSAFDERPELALGAALLGGVLLGGLVSRIGR